MLGTDDAEKTRRKEIRWQAGRTSCHCCFGSVLMQLISSIELVCCILLVMFWMYAAVCHPKKTEYRVHDKHDCTIVAPRPSCGLIKQLSNSVLLWTP